MNMLTALNELNLHPENAIVIGSGILSALGIRDSKDIDIITLQDKYAELEQTGRFTKGHSYGREILIDKNLEIGTSWGVLGKDQMFRDLAANSLIIDGVRYITLDFLLAVKQSWVKGGKARPKDIEDIALIQKYLTSGTA